MRRCSKRLGTRFCPCVRTTATASLVCRTAGSSREKNPGVAAVRELFEETGLTADGVTFLKANDLVYPGSGSR